MANRMWVYQLPVVAVFTAAFLITEAGVQGNLENKFLREKIFPPLKNVTGFFTDMKFKARGQMPPKNKVVIVEIDSPSLDHFGRWPWHRDILSYLIHKTFEAGAKVVGLDIVFSEPDQRVPKDLADLMAKQNQAQLINQFETDGDLAKVIDQYKDRLVLGWATESACQPLYDPEGCPVTNPDAIATHPAGYDKFAYSSFTAPPGFDPIKTASPSLVTFIANLPMYNAVAEHAGYFNSDPDPDGYVRRIPLFMLANGKPYPGLAIEMARVGLGEKLQLTLNDQSKVKSLSFANAGRDIPVTPLGVMEINFRGKGRTFPYISAEEVMGDDDILKDELNRKLAGLSKKEVLKDAYVLIGLSAVGVFDMRAFPFDSNVAGVEGHATILDNLLSGDMLVSGSGSNGSIVILFLMTVGALIFAYFSQKLEAVPALLLFLVAFGGLGVADLQFLFKNNYNWNTSFLCLELASLFAITLAAKYVMEENNKKFVKGAFSKYVSPAVVDSIIKDPTKLSLGGEKRELTIMFSDIRSFTTFSEKMDAKALAAFLNEYLTIMTDIVIKNQGTLDKYIGDAIMAFWGAPLDQPAHAGNACKAAFEMMQALAANKARFKQTYGIDVSIGIGVNSGMVSVGNMGSKSNFAYTVIGDHVNLSSRLEGLTKYYHAGALTTRFTLDVMAKKGDALPPHRPVDDVKVKGRTTAVELIQLLEKPYPEEGLKLFEEGRTLYKSQQWVAAIDKFKASSKVVLGSEEELDGPCEMYIERCNEFMKNPPEKDWDGSWKMDSK